MRKKRRNGRASTKMSVEDEIAHLRGLDLKGLRSRWQSVFQRPPLDHLPRAVLLDEESEGLAPAGRETNPDEGAQDWSDAQDLYRILEDEIVPRYYDRGENGLPEAWLALMRRSMASALWRFSTTRMLHDYVEKMYLPADRVRPLGITIGQAMALVKHIGVGSTEALRSTDLRLPAGA